MSNKGKSLEQAFLALENEISKTLNQSEQMNEKIIGPLCETMETTNDTINAIVFDQLEDEKSTIFPQRCSYGNAFEMYYKEELEPKSEQFRNTGALFNSAFKCKSNVTKSCFSCIANSFELIVNESWEEWVKELEDIKNDFETPNSLFSSMIDLLDYYRDNVNRVKMIEFVNILHKISKCITETNERMTSNLESIVNKAKNSKDKEASSELKKQFRSFRKKEAENIKEILDLAPRFEELLQMLLKLYAKFLNFYGCLNNVKRFNKAWNALDVLMTESEERIEKMLITPMILQVVYTRNDPFIQTIMPDVKRLVKGFKKLKPSWKQVYYLKRNETMENLDDTLDLLQALWSSWRDYKESLNYTLEDMKKVEKLMKSSSSLSALSDLAKKNRRLTDKLTKIVVIDKQDERERKKEEKRLKKEENKRRKEEERRMKQEQKALKKQERMRDMEGVSSGKVLIRGVENIGKDIQKLDVGKPFISLKTGLDNIGTDIKDKIKIPQIINPREMFNRGGLFGVFRNN
jgi:hypothetical protein